MVIMYAYLGQDHVRASSSIYSHRAVRDLHCVVPHRAVVPHGSCQRRARASPMVHGTVRGPFGRAARWARQFSPGRAGPQPKHHKAFIAIPIHVFTFSS